MVTVPTAHSKGEQRRQEIAPLKARCRVAGVRHDDLAAALKCTRPYVVNVFAGRKNATLDFIDTAIRLCEQHERRAARRAGVKKAS